MQPLLVLASASPQRRVLLESLGLPFEVQVSSVDEEAHPELSPAKRSQELAYLKAQNVACSRKRHWVIGCDTLVVAPDGSLLEKPRDEAQARKMLGLQSGGRSIVHSGVCVVDPQGNAHQDISSSSVFFRTLSERDIDWWMRTTLWQGRSGGFQIDGPGQLMIERIDGDWTGIVGLPVFALGQLLSKAGYPLYS